MAQLVSPILELCCSCLGQEVGNHWELEENVRKLTREMPQLRRRGKRVKERVGYAEEQLQIPRTTQVDLWLKSVECLDRDVVAHVEAELERGREPLLHWWDAPGRGWARYVLSRRVADGLSELEYLKHAEFEVVAEDPETGRRVLL